MPAEILGNQASMAELMKWVNSLNRDGEVADSGAFFNMFRRGPT